VTAIWRLLVVSAVVLVLGACGGQEPVDPQSPEDGGAEEGGDADGELTQIDVAFVPATTGVLLNVAEKEGLFEKHGLDAELTAADNISDVIPTLGQQFDISLGTSTDLIRAAEAGLDVVQISGNTISTKDNPFARLIVNGEADIESITDLEGRRMASPTPSGVINMAVRYWAQQEGLQRGAIEVVQVPPPNHPDQLNAGQVDASQALEPFASQLLGAGHESLGNPFAAIRLPLATNFWVAQGQWAEDNPEVVESFRDALADAEQFMADSEENEDRAREILADFTGMPAPIAQDVALPTFDLEVRTDDLATWVEVLQELDELDTDVDTDELVR
jgi:NitT/TauT family transport system substrate-binding protein